MLVGRNLGDLWDEWDQWEICAKIVLFEHSVILSLSKDQFILCADTGKG